MTDNAQLTISQRIDPLDHIGHDPRSPYAERFWLRRLGPSSLWLLRLFAYGFDTAATFTVNPVDVAQTIGLSTATSRLNRSIGRLEHFGMVKRTEPGDLVVRSALPWIDVATEHGLSPALRAEHQQWIDQFNATNPDLVELREISAQVTSMRYRGAQPAVIAAVLKTWNVSPATLNAVLAA
jgi:hypothetical protein